MFLPTSPEFVSLCRSQIALLIQGLGAHKSAIYLSEQLTDGGETSLRPIVVYPEELQTWPDAIQWQLPEHPGSHPGTSPIASPFLALGPSTPIAPPFLQELTVLESEVDADSHLSDFSRSEPEQSKPEQSKPERSDNPQSKASKSLAKRMGVDSSEPQQLVLPLMQDNAVLGVLMVSRQGLPWNSWEQSQLDQIAQTLSIAFILDQRAQWLSQSSYQQKALLSDEHHQLSKLLHQFRNPLTALKTLGKLMFKRLSPDDPNRSLTESIIQQSDRLETLLKEFDGTLDLGEAALESLVQPYSLRPVQPILLPSAGVISGAPLNLQPCWLLEILDPILSAIAGRIEEKQLSLAVEMAAELGAVRGDPQALNEVFSNLIDNAIKYTPMGGAIEITLRLESIPSPSINVNGTDFYQVFSVSDTGPGIPPQDLERIFDSKYRGIQAASNIEGTGLGLAIARELIQKMAGTIEAFSPATSPLPKIDDHPGSTFTVSLPSG